MKKTILLIVVALLLNGCRYINTEEKYGEAKVSPELTIPEGVDTPNTNSSLSVPKVNDQSASDVPDRTPPDMPLRTKQTDDGKLRIENRNGFALLTVESSKDDVWAKMQSIDVENWEISNTSVETCSILLAYTDIDAKEREEAGIFKRMITREDKYTDYSGIHKLVCTEKGSVVEVVFSKQDGTVAKSFLADNIMNKLYKQFK